jgi:hypothetical protein
MTHRGRVVTTRSLFLMGYIHFFSATPHTLTPKFTPDPPPNPFSALRNQKAPVRCVLALLFFSRDPFFGVAFHSQSWSEMGRIHL